MPLTGAVHLDTFWYSFSNCSAVLNPYNKVKSEVGVGVFAVDPGR